ncbi:HD-GYP domain-containing protein [Microbulbifer sp. HZ11]|uniref:HD-GYP domain-containing protein n=1 Tax=Microbulbifer sp. HZ11 TaxID=1453501 RepID=UPI0005BA3882|nr:HD-GYP domain-containing protein [Microbulbifer sp. HZ11]
MAIQQAKVFVEDLQRGMFVSRLDRPWTRTPFALQGFYIRDLEEIRQLQKYCRFVYVDVIKTVGDVGVKLRQITRAAAESTAKDPLNKSVPRRIPVAINCKPVQVRHNSYAAPESVRKEAPKARQLHQRIIEGMHQVMVQLQSNQPLPTAQVNQTVSRMVDSVLRSPDAFSWLARVREKDEQTYSHSVRASVWAVVFGRHIGLRRQELVQLGVATLLKDVGKLYLADAVLKAEKRDPRAELEYRKFVDYSVKLLSSDPNIDRNVLTIVQCHKEQYDGSGYPKGLRGGQIPVLARMCGIVTFYDEATNPRGAEFPVPPSKAVAQLYDLRNSAFQEQLVVEFIQSIGLYPTGTQVELSTGEIAVVVEQSHQRRLKPKVMLVTDAQKKLLPKPRLFDMAADDDRKLARVKKGKKSLAEAGLITIVQDMDPSRYPAIDVARIRDQYLYEQRLPAFVARFLPARLSS